ncbi:Mucin-16 [Manis pentadactyla]|nr:Mucin-16 [Manis pentadactyla]
MRVWSVNKVPWNFLRNQHLSSLDSNHAHDLQHLDKSFCDFSTGGIAPDTPATASQAWTCSAGTRRSAHSETAAVTSRGPEAGARTSPRSVEATGSPSSPVTFPATGSPAPASSMWPGHGLSSPAPVTSPVTSDLVNTAHRLGTGSTPGTSSAPNVSSSAYETPATFEAPTATENTHPFANPAAAALGTGSHSGSEPRSSVPIRSEPTTTASATEETTLPTSMPASQQTTMSETEPHAHLTSGWRWTSIALDSSPATPTDRPSSPLSAHLLKSPETEATPSTKTSVPGHLPPSHTEFPADIPVKTTTLSYTSLAAAGSAGATAFPESKLSGSASESAHHPSTAEAMLADTLTPEATASLPTSGVARARSPASSVRPFPRTEAGPGSATVPTIAESLPSSAPTPPPSATSAAPPGIASSPAAPRAVDASLGADSTTARGPAVMLSTLETWTQPVRTSSSPIRDSTVTESIDLGAVTSASRPPPHSTPLTRTDGIVEHITKIPREAVRGGTAGPIHVPLPSTSSASLRGLPTGARERAEATATALETPSAVTPASRVSSPTSGTPALFRTSGEVVSMGTAGATTTTPDVPPDVPERTASLAPRPGAEASTAVPWTASSVLKRGSETTPSLVSSSGAETRSAVATPTVTFGEPETATSWATHAAETSPTISRATLNVSHSESDTTSPTATSPGAEVSSAVRTTVSPGAVAMATSLVTSPEAETSMAVSTLTESPHEPETPATSATHPRTEASSAAPTVTVSPGEPDTTASWGRSSDRNTPVSRTALNFSHSESDTVPSMATGPGAEASSASPTATVSPGVPDTVTSQATRSGTNGSMVIPPLTVSPGAPDTTASVVTQPGAQTSSTTPVLTVSPGVPGVATSLVPRSGAETSTTFPDQTHSPHEPEATASRGFHSETEATSAVPTVTASPGEAGTTVSLATHPAETSPAVPGTASDFFPSESDTTASTATRSGAEASSAIPTTPISSGVPGLVTAQATRSGADITTTSPTLTVSPGQLEPVATRVAHSGIEASSALPTVTAFPGEPDTTASSATHPADTSPTVPRTAPIFSPSESVSTPSMATSLGTEAGSAVPTSADEPDVVTSQVPSAEADINMAIPTLTFSPGHPETTAPRITHPGTQTRSSVPAPVVPPSEPGLVTSLNTSSGAETSPAGHTLTVSPSEPDTTASSVTQPGTQTSSAIPALTGSPGASEVEISLVTSAGAATSTIIPSVTDSPPEPKTTASWVPRSTETNTPVIATTLNVSHSNSDTTYSMATRPGAEASSAGPNTRVSPGEPDTTASLVTSFGAEMGPTSPTPPESPREAETPATRVTHRGTEASPAAPVVTASPGEPHTTASWVISAAESSPTAPQTTPRVSRNVTDATHTPATRLGAEASSAVPTSTVSPAVPDVTSQASGVETNVSRAAPALRVSHEPATTASPVTHPSSETSSRFLASSVFPHLLESTASPSARPGLETSVAVPAQVSLGLPETTSFTPVTESSPADGSPPVSFGAPAETASCSTHTGVDVSTTVSASALSPSLSEAMGLLAASPASEARTGIPLLTVSPGVLEPAGSPAAPGEPYTVSTEPSPPTTSAGPPKSSNMVTGGTVTSKASETPAPPETSSGEGSHPTTILKTTTLETPDAAATGSGPTVTETTATFSAPARSPFVPVTTPAMSTVASVSVTSGTTAGVGPAPAPFTLNFTITNLTYTPDMRHPGSAKFSSTEKALTRLLGPLFRNTSIGPLYSGCRLTLLRAEKYGAAMGVDAICTYHPDPMGSGLDREELYRELSQLTYGVTRLGTYMLDRDSLYINGYNHRYWTTTTSTAGTSPSLVPFTISFTITSLRYTEDMAPPGSEFFNTTERILNRLLKPLLQHSSIGPLYSGCRLTLLRPEKNRTATGVDTVCTHRPDPMSLRLDRESLYWDLSRGTYGVTQLGSFNLDKDSLYVNAAVTSMRFPGTSVRPSLFSSSTAAAPFLVPFTLNFTITNLYYEEAMRTRGSWKFNSTERILQGQLGPLFKNTSVGRLYSGCRLTLLRPEKDGAATGVDAVCTYHPDPPDARLDRERLYRELSRLTRGVTRLGPYTLDQDSLCIGGYTHPARATTLSSHTHPASATTPGTTGPALVSFTLNVTVTNMEYTEDMGRPASLKFSYTERLLQPQLRLLLNKTSIGPLGADCRLASLRPKKDRAATRVDILCTFHSGPAGPRLDAERLYWELSRETHGGTLLGPFTLDRDSLYVNGHTYRASAPTITAGKVGEEPFSLNFTIDNLRYSADMGHPSSLKFNITDSLMQHLLGPLFQRSSLGAQYTGCKVTSLRSVKNGASTGVDILCAYLRPPSSPGLPTKRVFHELSWQTRGITRLGPYSLDKDSLYLNGYNERGPDEPPTTPSLATTSLPTSSPPLQPEATTALGYHPKTLTLNFTISSPQHPTDVSNSSAAFNSTERALRGLLGALLQKSSLGPFYSGCGPISLRPEKDSAATSVEAVCTYRPDPMGHGLDRERLYWELSQLTYGVTRLGPYTLARDSLFVGGYTPQGSPVLREYQLSFRILNRNISSPDPQSSERTALLRDVQDKIFRLYRGSQLQDVFRSCLVTDVTMGSMSVTVKALFSSSPDPRVVKQVFLDKTLNSSFHWLAATYQLTDVRVTELEPSVHLPTEKPTSSPSPQHFQLNFTVTNLPYSQDLAQPGSTQYQQNKGSIEAALNQLFQNSSIKTYFSDCEVSAFRPVPSTSHTGVGSLCTFSPLARRLDRVAIYEEFLWLTQNGSRLRNFTLDRDSILVDGYSPNRHEALSENSDLPFWAIILICLAGLLGFIMCLICCFLVTVFLRKKEGDYKVQQQRLGYYLPHLDFR